MADGKKETKIKIGAASIDAVQVEITKRVREEPNEYELEDGSIIRVTSPTVIVYRADSYRDWKDAPGYYVENATAVIVVRGPRDAKE